MDLHSFIESLKAVWAAAETGNLLKALLLGVDLIPIILESWSGPKPMLAAADEAKSIEQLCNELKNCCSMKFGPEQGLGPIAMIAWPILKALLLKILQGL